jgi:hypothetical protein
MMSVCVSISLIMLVLKFLVETIMLLMSRKARSIPPHTLPRDVSGSLNIKHVINPNKQ